MTTTITIKHPKHLVERVGAESDQVLPIHTVSAGRGLVLVYEPRRDCCYHVDHKQVYPPAKRTW